MSLRHRALVSFGVAILSLAAAARAGTPTIINDSGKWSGECQAIESGFFLYFDGQWKQTGANTGGESIETFLDDYSPVIASQGSNTVTATYSQVGWVWPWGGPTVSGSVSFNTANEVISVSRTPISIKTINSHFLEGLKNDTASQEIHFTFTITGSVKEAWSEETTVSDTITFSASKQVGGEVGIDSLVKISGSQTTGIENALTVSRTTSKSGEHESSVSTSVDLTLQPHTRVDIFVDTEVRTERLTVTHHLDANEDGLSEGIGTSVYDAADGHGSVVRVSDPANL